MSGIDYTDAATGLRIVDEPLANGIGARAVYRGTERIYHCKPVGVGYFLKGYAAAKAEPIEALLEDPRISDVHVLEAARTILEERGQDVENLSSALWAMKCTTVAGRDSKRCTLCRCDATDAVYGFEVCAYHVDHTEDDPPCPKCEPERKVRWVSDAWIEGRNATVTTDGTVDAYDLNAKRLPQLRQSARFTHYTEALEAAEKWARQGVWEPKGAMRQEERDGLPVHVGDRVRDPMDGTWRTVKRIEGTTVYLEDGGCMGIDECREIRLPSEDLDG